MNTQSDGIWAELIVRSEIDLCASSFFLTLLLRTLFCVSSYQFSIPREINKFRKKKEKETENGGF